MQILDARVVSLAVEVKKGLPVVGNSVPIVKEFGANLMLENALEEDTMSLLCKLISFFREKCHWIIRVFFQLKF